MTTTDPDGAMVSVRLTYRQLRHLDTHLSNGADPDWHPDLEEAAAAVSEARSRLPRGSKP